MFSVVDFCECARRPDTVTMSTPSARSPRFDHPVRGMGAGASAGAVL